MEEAEEADSVRDGNDNDLRVLFYEVVAIILRVCRSTSLEAATVNPHDDWLLLCLRLVSLPDVQIQAVLARTILKRGIAR